MDALEFHVKIITTLLIHLQIKLPKMKKVILFFALILSLSIQAQKKKTISTTTVELTRISPDSVFKNLAWRNIGPTRGGRANAISGVVNNPLKFYTGYTGGGVWQTNDGGIQWKNISDGYFNVGSIGDIAVSESDPNVIYVGTGEHAVRGVMTSYGDGVYKSNDAGVTWKNIGLGKTRHISEICVHPTNPAVVYVAAQGTVHGPNNERGVYKSEDGGTNWKRVLYINDSTGIASLSMDMNNPRILYAAAWEHRRFPWTVSSGGKGSSIWKSTDEGNTWTKLTTGLPDEMGKIGVSVSRVNGNRVFAIVETEKKKSGLYRSDDAGATWTLLSNNQDISSRSWYYMKVYADTKNENLVYVLNAPMMRSIDGGKTFSNVKVGHGDTHDLWINPKSNQEIGLADDGGGEISYDQANSWSSLMNQSTAQFYRVNTDNVFPYKVYGGQQDNSSVIIASRNNTGTITMRDWNSGAGCESAFLTFDPNHPELVYGGCYQGYIEVLNTKTNEVKDIQAYPSLNLAIQPKDMKYRFNWNAPIVTSMHNPKIMYHAANVLLKTTNGGLSWEPISPDLTRNDKTKQGPGGIPFTNEGAGGENYNTIFYVTESPLDGNTIYTGSDCGLVNMTTDGGKTWKNITPADLQECQINSIEASSFDKGVVYISATRYKLNDYASYTYKTTDNGTTWTKINKGVKEDDFIKVIREDKKSKNILYAGSERGFYISNDAGNTWQIFQLNLPIVPVTDIMIRDNDLVIATAGRAFWILDDVSAIQQNTPFNEFSSVQLMNPKPSYKYGAGNGLPEKNGEGQNAAEGVILDYYLPAIKDKDTLSLEIIASNGNIVRTYTNIKDAQYKKYPGGPAPETLLSTQKGHNRFLWNFKTNSESPDVNGVYVLGSYAGYAVAPGNYQARLKLNTTTKDSTVAQTSTINFVVLPNPFVNATSADWVFQQKTLANISQHIKDIHTSVNNLRKVKKQLQYYTETLTSLPTAKTIREEANSLVAKIDTWEANIVESRTQNGQDVINWPSKLNVDFFFLKGLVDVSDPVITAGVKNKLADLQAQWATEKSKLGSIYDAIKNFNIAFKDANIAALQL